MEPRKERKPSVLTYDLQRDSTVPLYEQLYRCLRRDIEQGHLKPWAKLPPKREFARHLGVSVITVEGAYRQLVAEGYAYAQERRGHFVASLALPSDQERRLRRLGLHPTEAPVGETPLREVLLGREGKATGVWEELGGQTAPALQGVFPYKTWARATRQVLAEESEASLQRAASPTGALRLRRALAAYLRASRERYTPIRLS